jgi:hypothetical protein
MFVNSLTINTRCFIVIQKIQRFSGDFSSWFKINNANRTSSQFLNNSLKNSKLRQRCRGETFGVKVVKLINKVVLNGKMWDLFVYFCLQITNQPFRGINHRDIRMQGRQQIKADDSCAAQEAAQLASLQDGFVLKRCGVSAVSRIVSNERMECDDGEKSTSSIALSKRTTISSVVLRPA